MTDRERQRHLDILAIRFVQALEAGDFAAIDRLWTAAATDPELETVLLETAAELAETYETERRANLETAVTEAVEQHMPSAELFRPLAGPLTVALKLRMRRESEVGSTDHPRRRHPAGLGGPADRHVADDLRAGGPGGLV